MGKTIAEKILSRAAGRPVSPGEIVFPFPDLITVHDGHAMNLKKDLDELGVRKMWHADRVILSCDHHAPLFTVQEAEKLKSTRAFAREFQIGWFFDTGQGNGHILPMEHGLVRPGMFALAYDIHVANFGAVGALGLSVNYDISTVCALGSVWIEVPKTVRIHLIGTPHPTTSPRDIAQHIIRDIGDELANHRVFEYGGRGIAELEFSGWMTLCNLPIEIGAVSAVVEPNARVLDWVRQRTEEPFEPVWSDSDADYEIVKEYDLSGIEPLIAAPSQPDNIHPLSEYMGMPIHVAVIASCAIGYEDLKRAAWVLNGRQVDPGVRLVIAPPTHEMLQRATRDGLIDIFLKARALVLPPGCGPCIGGRGAALADGEVCVATITRNDPGRMGSPRAEIYLGSSTMVAASALTGRITDPREFNRC